MILVRQVFQAKYGQAGQVATLLRESAQGFSDAVGPNRRWRVLTDLSGTFDTVVIELEVESLTAWEQLRQQLFTHPAIQESSAQFAEAIAGGRNELFTIEAQG